MSDVPPAGQRRIDRVLAEDFLAGLAALPLAELRQRRSEAEQEEADLSYLRRLVQGRLDILRAELAQRGGAGGGSLVGELAQILGEGTRGPAHGLGRHSVIEPSRTGAHRRRVEALVADVDLSNTSAQNDEQLRAVLGTLVTEEQSLSSTRRAVQAVMDACSAEITRRYRDGEADVADLLPTKPAQPPSS